jgi:hypothetical protein
MEAKKTDASASEDHTPQFAQSANWGAAGSYVFDPVTRERLTEQEHKDRQRAAKASAPAPTKPPGKGA